MVNTEMRIYGIITKLTRPLSNCSPSSRQLGHMTTLFTSLFLFAIDNEDVFVELRKFLRDFSLFPEILE